MTAYHRVLTIAGSDSGGGAGIQADLKTFAALGCYGMSVITALTAQNTVSVTGIYPAPPEFIAQQIDAVMQDIGVDAVKIGMLHSPAVIETVAERLTHYGVQRIVVDPVMVSKSGASLLQSDAVHALRDLLLPIATVVTPNLPEASVLLQSPIERQEQMQEGCRQLASMGPAAVLLKGGHLLGGHSDDLLYCRADDRWEWLDAARVETANTHGTGCTLSSAIAAGLAKGYGVPEAVRQAKTYITEALRAGAAYRLGHGHGPVHHFYAYWS